MDAWISEKKGISRLANRGLGVIVPRAPIEFLRYPAHLTMEIEPDSETVVLILSKDA
jgi:hypothetical protein